MIPFLTVADALSLYNDSFTIDSESTIGSAVSKLEKFKDCLIVADKQGRYDGIISPSRIFFHSRFPLTTKAKHASQKTRYLYPSTPLSTAAGEMVALRTYTLPVFDEDRNIIGLTSSKTIMRVVSNYPDLIEELCKNIEFADPITASIDTNVGVVYKLMRDHNVSRVILVDEEGRLAGITSRSDIRSAFVQPKPRERYHSRSGTTHDNQYDKEEVYRDDAPIRSFMTQKVLTMSDTKDCTEVVPILTESGKNSIVLINSKQQPTKFISTRTVLQALGKIAQVDSVPLLVNLPEKHGRTLTTRVESVVGNFVRKLHTRSPIRQTELIVKEAKSPVQNIQVYHTKLHIKFKNGQTLWGEGKERQELASVRSALLKIERQQI